MPWPDAKAAISPEQEEQWRKVREQIGLPSDVRCAECGAKPAWFGHHPSCSLRAPVDPPDRRTET